MCTCCSVFVLQSERVSELWNLPLGHALEDVATGSMATGTMATGKRGVGSGNNGQQRITPTLVALIVVFTVCVGPSGLLDFFREHQLIDLCTDSQNISRQSYDYLAIILR